MKVNFGIFSFDEKEDYNRLTKQYKKWRERYSNPLKNIELDKITLALANSIEYLLGDRISDGIGEGGWGYSDIEYMKLLYDLKAYNPGKESIMTTAVCIMALNDSLLCLDKLGILLNTDNPKTVLNNVFNDLKGYLDPRWDKKKGCGGILNVDHESGFIITPQYRHTAWLLHLWKLIPGYRDRMRLTAANLLMEFDAIDWISQKVATAVTAYSAFSLLENDPLCISLGTETPSQVKHYKYVLEGHIESQYSIELSGWTSGNALQGGRQLYTLFVCAEMAKFYPNLDTNLKTCISNALKTTMSKKWRSVEGYGVPVEPEGHTNISASALCVSALIRKPDPTPEEKDFLIKNLEYVIDCLSKGSEELVGTFSWALSYFVRDISYWLGMIKNQ